MIPVSPEISKSRERPSVLSESRVHSPRSELQPVLEPDTYDSSLQEDCVDSTAGEYKPGLASRALQAVHYVS